MSPTRTNVARAAPCEKRSEKVEETGDADLLVSAALGDGAAFTALSTRHARTMMGVAQRILGNAAEADEVAQEAFLRLWRYAPKWDPNGAGSVKTWLSRVVTNLCLDRLRRRRSVPLEDVDEIVDPSRGPFDTLGEEDRRQIVQELLLALPERQRIAIVFAYFEGLSGQEIAAAMGASVGAVESLLVRGREGLRKGLQLKGLVWSEDL